MPFYDYYCPANNRTIEVRHSIKKRLKNWGEVCKLAKVYLSDTPADSPVKRLISSASISSPISNSKLKELGFTKLVKRDKGVYENVTKKQGRSK